METVGTALVSSLTEIGTSIMGTIGAVLPVAIPVLGAIVVIGVGIRVFKKLAGK